MAEGSYVHRTEMVTEGGLELQKAENSVMVSSRVNLEDGFGCD